MSTTLAATALLMGLAGGPHCAGMCGAACGALGRVRGGRSLWEFQAGRLAGYSLAGAGAAFSVQSFAWLSAQSAGLRPLWTLFHLAVLGWGLMLVVQARQPGWLGDAGRAVWSRVRPAAAAQGGAFTAGALWALMPCGLLYSALLVASLSGGPLEGALSMALFALGSTGWLMMAPWLLMRLQGTGNALRRDWGTRAAGALLVLVAAWGLWMDTLHRIAIWCGLA